MLSLGLRQGMSWVFLLALLLSPNFIGQGLAQDDKDDSDVKFEESAEEFTKLSQFSDEEKAAAAAAVGFVLIGGICFGLVIFLAVMAVVCVLISGCFKRIPAQFRLMEPGMVWLMMIPIFHLVWMFFVTLKLSDSFKRYFDAHGRADVGDCGRMIGLAACILSAGGMVLSFLPLLNLLAPFLGLGALVTFIIYLVKVLGLKGQIPEGATS